MRWKEYKLGDVLEIHDKLRKPLSSIERTSFKGEYPYYGAQGIIDYVKDYKCNGMYMLIAEDGENLSSRTQPIARIVNGKFWVNNHAHIVRTNELADLKFICDLLNYSDIAGYVTGSAQPKLSQENLNKIIIVLPSLDIQKKIASILSNYDTLIDINTKRIKLLEESARELYKEWFVRMRFPGHEKTKFVKGIPEGWKYSSLQDFGRIETGKTPSMEKPEYYGGDYLFIKTPDMHDSIFVLDTTETLSEAGNNCQRNKLLPVNSIMVSCIGSTGIGAVAINAKQGHTNQQINSIILYNQEWLTWLYFTCESLKPTIEMYGATGSTMTNLSKGKFENLKVIEPTADIIRQFNKLESPLFEEIKNLQLQNQNLATTRDRLLPRLLSGELKVKA